MNNHSAPSVWRNSHKIGLVGLLLAQFAIAYVVGTKHLLTNDSLSLFLPIGITVAC